MVAGKDLLPGYLFKVTTWENDGDNYNTKEIAGIKTTDEVNFYIAIVSLFESADGTHGKDPKDRRYGNCDCHGWDDPAPDYTERYYRETDYYLTDDIIAIVDEFKSKGYTVPEEWDYTKWDTSHLGSKDVKDIAPDWYSDMLYDLGLGHWGEGEYRRMFEDFEVFFVPSEIENVTHKFT